MKKNDQQNNQNGDQQIQKHIEELNNRYLRALADYQNLARQTEEWKREFVSFASSGLILKLLEVLDDLEKAQENINDDGLLIVISKFKKVLESEGLEELKLDGQKYDPNLAEAVSMVPVKESEEENIVTQVLQKGYKMKEKVIRPGKVIVSKKE